MKEKIKQERATKLQNILDAAVEHLERALATLEDANLYTNEVQERRVDIMVKHLENLTQDVRAEYHAIPG